MPLNLGFHLANDTAPKALRGRTVRVTLSLENVGIKIGCVHLRENRRDGLRVVAEAGHGALGHEGQQRPVEEEKQQRS